MCLQFSSQPRSSSLTRSTSTSGHSTSCRHGSWTSACRARRPSRSWASSPSVPGSATSRNWVVRLRIPSDRTSELKRERSCDLLDLQAQPEEPQDRRSSSRSLTPAAGSRLAKKGFMSRTCQPRLQVTVSQFDWSLLSGICHKPKLFAWRVEPRLGTRCAHAVQQASRQRLL